MEEREFHGSSKDFGLILSNDVKSIKEIIPVIERVWDTKNAHGTMNKE